ncbi:HSP20-like chaperone, partial [Lasiosphaeris hirsuta]
GYDTLAHFLHTFHSHYGTAAADEDEPFGTTHPHFDLAEGRRGYVLYGELPGLKRDEVVVETDDHSYTVTVSGVLRRRVPGEVVKTAGEADEEEVHWHVGERRVGRFQRAFRFPVGAVDMDLVSASMQDGVLCAVVPK